ncbi:CGNR zinc finger domain-containing protein [Actinophytocola sp.]|uniref:CGNR zinc finger domain-containing protein n=1 Tax=Actinophytocola sp. TaxID=1872138 RepID=UPI003D6B4F2A
MTIGGASTDADVDLVLDFLNTVDVEDGTDLLDDPAGWRAWLAAHGLSTTGSNDAADSAGDVRSALRAAVGDPGLDRAALSAQVTVTLDAGGPRLVADEVVGAVLAAASRLAVLGEWDRIKICPADDCRWAFFDRSRNHSRTWCSMRVCGNREKARAWRERARQVTT